MHSTFESRLPVRVCDGEREFQFLPAGAQWRAQAREGAAIVDFYFAPNGLGDFVPVIHRWAANDPQKHEHGAVVISIDDASRWLKLHPLAMLRAACLQAHRLLNLMEHTANGRRSGAVQVEKVWKELREAQLSGALPCIPGHPVGPLDMAGSRRAVDVALRCCEQGEARLQAENDLPPEAIAESKDGSSKPQSPAQAKGDEFSSDGQKRRKKPAEERHQLWAKWVREESLSHQQVATRHKDQTGEDVSRDAVSKALKRLEASSTDKEGDKL